MNIREINWILNLQIMFLSVESYQRVTLKIEFVLFLTNARG